ncbi:MAG: hypothetical protein ACI9XZ_003938, partial [Alphaproteobacteria bacterium]
MHFDRELSELQLRKRSKVENGEAGKSSWVCGHMSPGQPCVAGPGGRGQCSAAYTCSPVQLGDVWTCDRATANGGACKEGPAADGSCCNPRPACIPIRSARAQHDTVAAWVGLAVLGAVVMVISFAGDTKFLMPGPLSTSHSSVGDCAGCHANVGTGQFGWLHSFIKATNPAKDSATCLTCHKIGDGAMQPHGLSAEELQATIGEPPTQKISIDTSAMDRLRDYLLPVKKISKKEVFCATCHKEHRNNKVDIKSMPDNRCQTCHAVQFTQFDKDHPEFKAYPFARRTRIKFSHSSHIDTHFPEWKKKNAARNGSPDTCAGCHTTAGDQQHMSVKPFRQTCAACHVDQIVGKERASGPQGVALLALPGIDLRTIKENGQTVGEWPSESEAELTPLMKLLLGGSAPRRKLLAKVDKLDLLDLTKAS